MVKADYLRAEVKRLGPVCVLAVGGELDLFTVARFAGSAVPRPGSWFPSPA